MEIVTILGIALAASLATFIGGLLALKLRDKLHLVLGFSAGAVIAVAFFDLIPEALELGISFFDPATVILATAIGFFLYMVLDRTILLHTHADGDSEEAHGHTKKRGWIGAGSLSSHSFLDGFAIGLAFQASPAVGAVVAVAVLTHDFSDGINTVNMILKNGGTRKEAFHWLAVDAAAPLLGATATLFITLPASTLSLVLALFAGFFLYIGASDLLPESHHAHPKVMTTVMTLLGAGVLYTVITLAGV
ncbi:MAG: solute carrier family 39 (zinc transporter), member 7 [Parcubacteria bacterium C7867-004]|nr:MAG: solute carrier family 39 (zinc transporter), member 7 [Parcubacteria bacterium C7867-004]